MADEEEVKKKTIFSSLLDVPTPESIAKLAERLGNKCPLFKAPANPGTTALAILLVHSVSSVHKDIKSDDILKITILCRSLLEYFKTLLSHCNHGDDYIIIYKCIFSLSTGQELLEEHDLSLLRNIVKDIVLTNQDIVSDQSLEGEDSTHSKTEGRTHVQKLFSQMKTGGVARKKVGPLSAFELSSDTPIKSVLSEVTNQLREMKLVHYLMEYSLGLPVLLELKEKRRELFTSCRNKTEQYNRLLQLKTAIDSIHIITCLSTSLTPLTPQVMTDLTQLVQCAILASITCLNGLNNSLLVQGSPKTRDVPVVATTEGVINSIEELMKSLQCGSGFTGGGTGKSVVCDLVFGTGKVIKKIESVISDSPRSKVLDVYRTMIVYDIFSGLTPLLLPSIKGTELKTSIGQTKLTIPLGHLIMVGVQLSHDLLSSLSQDPEQESLPRIQGAELDVNSSYSKWQLVQLLVEGVSLISILLSISHSSFRKVIMLLNSPSSQEGSQTELTTDAFTTPLRTDKQEQLFKRLQVSLSTKISEVTKQEEGETGSETVSPSSTISSSGEVRGEYVVNPEQEEQREEEEEEREEDEDTDYEDVDMLMGSVLIPGMFTPASVPAPPPPPPLPPKRSKLVQLEGATPLGPPLPPRGMKYLLRGEGSDIKRKPLFYQSLALDSLSTLLQGLVQNPCGNLQSVLVRTIGSEHIASLTWLFLHIQKLSRETPHVVSFKELNITIQELIHDLVVSKVLSLDLHGPLLRDLGLVPGCWPLAMTPPTLSILACVLILRSEREDDPLSLNIWKGFLSTLEENAANENENEEDLPVTHLQLLLVVWHSFSESVRKLLLVQCVNAVIRVADERRTGSLVSPLACCRLLLVLQYMVFQYHQFVPQLLQQVETNLLPGGVYEGEESHHVMSFPCDQEFQYQRVFSKPGVSPDVSKYKKKNIVYPLFYNVTPPDCTDSKREIDSDACTILLTSLPPMEEEGTPPSSPCSPSSPLEGKGGYDRLHKSLITLMSCGMDYRLYSEHLHTRVVAACAGHQCMDICLQMLISLPPSHSVLTAIVDGCGLSCKNDYGSCLLILVLLFSIKLRLQVDTDDILDTLTVSGYSSDTSEELMARVLSVVNSTEHFITLTTTVLDDLSSIESGQSLPLISITAANLLICLLQRTLHECIDGGGDTNDTNEGEGEGEGEKRDKENEQLKLKFYQTHSQTLIPILLKVTRSLANSTHRNICIDLFHPDTNVAEDMIEVINKILSLSSCKLILSKPLVKPLFIGLIPIPMSDRLKTWNGVPLIDKSQLDILCSNINDDVNVIDEIFNTLHSSIISLSSKATYSPDRLLKTTLMTSFKLLHSLFSLHPVDSCDVYCDDVIPFATDVLCEFAAVGVAGEGGACDDTPLKDIAKLFNANEFSVACMNYKVIQCFQLIHTPQLSGHTFQGALLEDIFILLNHLLDSIVDWPIITDFDSNQPPNNIIDLLMLCSLSSMCTSSLSEGLKLLVKILDQSDKNTHNHLTVLCGQIATLALVPADKLGVWLRRVVLGCVNDSTSDTSLHVNSFYHFVELLVKDDCLVPTHLCHSLLNSLLSLGSDLLTSLHHYDTKLYTIFKDYFHSCVLLANKQPNKGHYELAKSATLWLPMCAKLMTANGNDWRENSDVLIPMSSIMAYISKLTSAVQLVTNKSLCDERRSLAGEDDYTVLIEEEDDDATGHDMDDDQQGSDEESLHEKLCTFTETSRDFRNQHWYHCHTCKLTDGTGCCSVCVKVCHKGHDVTYSKLGSFFCDCGAKEDGSCKALLKRRSKSMEEDTVSPTLGESSSRHRKRKRKSKSRSRKSDKKSLEDTKLSSSSSQDKTQRSPFPSTAVLNIAKQIEPYKEILAELLLSSSAPQCCLDLLYVSLPRVLTWVNKLAMGSSFVVESALNELHTCNKKIEHVDNIMSSTISCQESAVDNVKLTLSGDQGQLMKQLLTGGGGGGGGMRVIRRCAMATMITTKHQHLVISQDKGKVTFFQLASLLKQADSGRKKLSVSRVSSLVAPFPVMSLCANPCNGEVLAICGIKDCQVVTINTSGSPSTRISLHPSVDTPSGYIVKCMWLPGSETELAIVTDTFVKIYDLSVDTLSPLYYFIACSDKIRDASFIVTDDTQCVIVMMSTGELFCQPMIPECSASEGPVYFTVDFITQHSNIQVADGRVCEGGASVYYSHSLQMLFFSYKNGKTFMCTVDGSLSKANMIVEVTLKSNTTANSNNDKTSCPPLLDWQEVKGHPGLITAVTGTNISHPVAIMVKPDCLLVHEVKPLSLKSKIQGTALVIQQSSSDTATSHTALVMIAEDGSLRVQFTTNSDSVLHWLNKQYQPATPLAYLTQFSNKSIKVKKRTTPPKIPVDFFENCTRMQNNELEFGGADILHVYNKGQVKNRFNVGGLYVASTKPAGFTIDITNLQSDTTVMVGARVLLGCRSLERTPSYIEVYGRKQAVTFPGGIARWFDVPLTREESMQSDKQYQLTFGPSMDVSGVNIVDCVRVYVKIKEEFGWPERPLTPGLALSGGGVVFGRGEEEGGDKEVVQLSETKRLGPVDRLVCDAFSILGNHYLSSSSLVGVSDVVKQATPLLTLSTPSLLQYHTRFLVSCIVSGTPLYTVCKDHLQLFLIKEHLYTESISSQPELYQHLLLMLLVICKSRPSHLSLLSVPLADTLRGCDHNESEESNDGCGLWVELINRLNEVFWSLYKRKPSNSNIAPVCNTGLVAIELTVNVLMEIEYTVSLQFPELLATCITHWIKLLTAIDTQISSSCVKVLTKLLKPHPLKISEERGEEIRETSVEQEQPVTDHTPTPPVAEQPDHVPPPLQAVLANPQAAMQHLIANPNLLGMMPDEETMMNLAIAMSLHEEGGGQGAAVHMIQDALHNLGVPERSISPILVHHGGGGGELPNDNDLVLPNMEEEEEEEEGHPSAILVDPSMIIDSLNSSYEDLIGEGGGVLPQPIPVLASNSGHMATPTVMSEGGATGRKDKNEGSGQDVSSELDNPNDSSGEEDAEDSSFMDVYEQFDDKIVTGTSVVRGGETTPSDTKETHPLTQEVITPQHQLRLKLLITLSEHLPEVEKVGGARAIPFMQLIVFLCGYLESNQRDGETYNILLKSLLKQLECSNENPAIIMERSHRSEVLLLVLRFLNIIMSRKRIRTEKSEGSSAIRLWYSTAEKLLSWNCLTYCLNILKGLLKDKRNFQNNESSSSSIELLKPHSHTTHMDMSPFFQQQYVKYHSSDIFETYNILLADIVLALPCQLKKFSEKIATGVPPSPSPPPSTVTSCVEFNEEWMETLCEYFMATSNLSSSNKKQIRKVLIYVCGSKDNYRLIRDKFALQSYMNKINDICSVARFDVTDPSTTLIHLSYDTLLKMIEQLRLCDEVARTRTDNWQSFCIERKETLPALFTISLSIDEGLSLTLLQLIFSALSGSHPGEKKDDTSQKRDKTKKGGKEQKLTQKLPTGNQEYSVTLCQLLLETISDVNIERFIVRYLLQSNQSTLRWQTHSLIHTLYKHSPPTQQVHLVQLLWKLWPDIPKHGHKASQFVDLLGYCSISTEQVLQKDNMCDHLVQQAMLLLRQQNALVAAHPNCHVYSQLVSLVDFDGHYLESEPCLVCNDPEVSLSVMKLFSIKSDVRYSANTIFIKLTGSYTFTQLMMRISEIRRSKMMRTINLYYSNRTIQNVIELKNNRSLWLKACSCTLQPSQTELKFEFPLPIIARNVILEFADFYENTQVGSEMLQCPRCNASVPAYPGVCAACGENAHQCQKCRTINYDERDPFLCISCGFSKYARFETQVEGRTCSAVDPIENEDDRKKTLLSINQLLEKADTVYKKLVDQRNELDRLLVSLASGSIVITHSGMTTSSESGVNKAIQAAAQMYCNYCKTDYNDLSKIIQSVLSSRKELVAYDIKKLQSVKNTSDSTTPLSPLSEEASLSLPLSATPINEGNCFGCASSTLEQCITVLKALAFKPETRKLMRKNLIEELMEFNLRSGSASLQKDVQGLLCQLTRDDLESTRNLNEFITQRVLQNIKPQRTSPNLSSNVQAEIRLLTASVAMEDSCWEERLRTVMYLFKKSRCHTSPVVMAAVTMPCLNILRSLVSSCTSTLKETQAARAGKIHTRVKDWLRGDPNCSFDAWKKDTQVEASREMQLSRKYFQIWLNKLVQSKVDVSLPPSILNQTTWLRTMLFNRSSSSARKSAYGVLLSLCKGDQRQRQILDLLSSFLDEVSSAGEASEDFLVLFHKLISEKNGLWKIYLARSGILSRIGTLIEKEINYLRKLEESTLSSDLSQGCALQMLTSLLKSFLKEESIKQQYKGQLVGLVLNGYLSLKRLVIQRTKFIDQSQKILLNLLETLTSGTEIEKQDLMAVCIEILSNYPMSDLVTPIFVFEQLCSIIHPEEEDVGEFYLQLDKDPQQEEFLQGRMQGNPYSSKDPGVGPLMRDVKNKICTDCELVALLEDDTGMELLVCNKIISLDLPVKEVYKKIWCTQPNHGERMKVVYRMRGLLGDATEDMVESLDNGKGEDINEEEVYKMAAVLGQANRLDAILLRLSQAKHFLRSHGLIHAGLKLLSYCVKIKTNRQYLIQPHLHTLKILLSILNMALQHEQLQASGLGATVAQQVLSVTEPILQEASTQQRVIVRSISEEVMISEEEEEEEDSTLQTLLRHVESPFVQSNLGVREGLMHIIPFLTFGDPKNMKILLEHFSPYLDFERFDSEETPEHSLYLDCFSVIATGIGTDAGGQKLKDLLIEMKITMSVIDYIKNKTPPKGNGRFDTEDWTGYISHPSLPYVLKILTGLSQHHINTQLVTSDAIPQLHLLEQVSSTVHHIGTLAEKLLDSLRENKDCDVKIQEARRATRSEKKKRAMEMRAKELGALGFQVNDKGQMVAETPSAFKEIENEVVEETGLRCCICLEGYRNQPQKILGVYTYTRKVTLDEFENKPRKSVGYATVSHFNVVHYECHSSAIKLARGRDEWESATLQNASTRCNGLLPIWGPKVSDSAFATGLANHNSYLQACTGLYDPSFRSYSHDLRLLLLRFANETSFSAESGGGGPQSNLHLIPYFIHVALYVLDTTRVFQREEKNLSNALTSTCDKWIPMAYDVEGPLLSAVLSLFVHSLSQWEEHKLTFLKQLLVLAHARKTSSSPIKMLPAGSDVLAYADYKPVLVFYGMIDALQKLLKKTISVSGPELPQAILDHIRNNDKAISEDCDKVLSKYQDELLPAESFEEFCDISGLLSVISNPVLFMKELIGSVTGQ